MKGTRDYRRAIRHVEPDGPKIFRSERGSRAALLDAKLARTPPATTTTLNDEEGDVFIYGITILDNHVVQ